MRSGLYSSCEISCAGRCGSPTWRSLGNNTPKWLTMRLRELERAGLLERIQEVGRREVRYSLTAKGRELGPVIAALNFWGVHNAISALQPDEQVTSARMIESLRGYLVTKRVQPSRPLALALCFGEDERAVLRFDGRQWFRDPSGAPADVTVATPHASWVALFVSKPVALLATLGVDGEAWAIDELRAILADMLRTANDMVVAQAVGL